MKFASRPYPERRISNAPRWLAFAALLASLLSLGACSGSQTVHAVNSDTPDSEPTVGVASVTRKPLDRQLTLSSELVPYQEIDVYAKESGYVNDLRVDYGSRVQQGQVMAILEIPELKIQLQQDTAAIASANEMVTRAQHQVDTLQAQHDVVQKQSDRMKEVDKAHQGLLAQQELDDYSSKAIASASQVEAGKSAYETAKANMDEAKAKLQRDQVMFDYARITAPFTGVVTQRFANLGTLMQAGTSSSTQALPLVRLSEDDKFRLVIPVPESYVKYIHLGDPVRVHIGSLDKTVPGIVARFSVEVASDTRTMHTEVDVPNPSHLLMPGLYAEATLSLERKASALVIPLQAVTQANGQGSIFLVDPNDTLQERKITLGLQTPTDVEVLSGLNEGDRVVVSDRSSLKAGLHVKPQKVDIVQYQNGNSQ